ncbi:MAG TPA: 50S ribosomal protein L20 [Candidatus Saccharimonadales bacterium]|nr:50S ribosomal protein L20 [Candidatus Saccharimonadales bacterium]
MPRVKRGVTTHKRHKRLLARAKGFRGGRHNLFQEAHQAVVHAGADAYVGRKDKKGDMRSLWIIRINAALEPYNISYSKFIAQLKSKKVELDRKVLSQIAQEDPTSFAEIVKKVA